MKYITLLIAILSIANVYAQRNITIDPEVITNYHCIDTSNITIRYSFKYKLHSTDKNYCEDIRILQIGSKVVKEFSEIAFIGDSLRTIDEKDGRPYYSSNPEGIFPYELFYTIREKKMDIKCRLAVHAGVLLFQPKQRNVVWNFSHEECKVIRGYNCNKATTLFAGRQYTAWYSLDVPVHYGPYKFSGLPGMIVELEELTGMYIWQLASVNATSRLPILNIKYENEIITNEAKAYKTVSRIMRNPIAFEKSIYPNLRICKMKNGKLVDVSPEGVEYPYEPIELE